MHSYDVICYAVTRNATCLQLAAPELKNNGGRESARAHPPTAARPLPACVIACGRPQPMRGLSPPYGHMAVPARRPSTTCEIRLARLARLTYDLKPPPARDGQARDAPLNATPRRVLATKAPNGSFIDDPGCLMHGELRITGLQSPLRLSESSREEFCGKRRGRMRRRRRSKSAGVQL